MSHLLKRCHHKAPAQARGSGNTTKAFREVEKKKEEVVDVSGKKNETSIPGREVR
jgi:hypothetical protein